MTAYPQLLDALHERVAPGTLTPSPGGYVMASRAALPEAPSRSFDRLGAAVVATGRPGEGPAADLFATGLLDLHHDLLRGALRDTMSHLESRTSGGSTLLAMQLVQGQLADVALRLAEDDAMPAHRRSHDAAARWRTHRRLVATGRRLLRLLGARGVLAEPPAAGLYLAELAGAVYLQPRGRP
jgi:hypothetical protein